MFVRLSIFKRALGELIEWQVFDVDQKTIQQIFTIGTPDCDKGAAVIFVLEESPENLLGVSSNSLNVSYFWVSLT